MDTKRLSDGWCSSGTGVEPGTSVGDGMGCLWGHHGTAEPACIAEFDRKRRRKAKNRRYDIRRLGATKSDRASERLPLCLNKTFLFLPSPNFERRRTLLSV